MPALITTAELLQATLPRATYLGSNIAPHASTSRASIAVPAAKRAELHAYLEITRITAAGTNGRVSIEVTAGGTRVARLVLFENTIGVNRRITLGPITLAPGETLDALTEDLSTGGTVDYVISLYGVQWGLS
jgi:hypothetical protein